MILVPPSLLPPSPVTPTTRASQAGSSDGTVPLLGSPAFWHPHYGPYTSNTPPSWQGLPVPPQSLPPPAQFNVSELEYEFLRGRSGLVTGSLLEGLEGSMSHWDTEDKLLVFFRLLKRFGYSSLGEFLADLFGTRHKEHAEVVHSLSAFLRQRSRVGTRPADIVEKMFNHPQSERYHDRRPLCYVFPQVPRYARGPEARYRPGTVTSTPELSARNSILQWSLNALLKEIDRETARLRKSVDGQFTLGSDCHLSWDLILSWKTSEKEVIIAREAPVTYAILCTLSVSGPVRTKLDDTYDPLQPMNDVLPSPEAFHANLEEDEPSGEVLPSSPLPDASDMKLRRNPYYAVVITRLAQLYMSHKMSSTFPSIIGVVLFMCRANKNIFNIFSHLGLSIAHSTTITKLHQLADDSRKQLLEWLNMDPNGPFDAELVFDNINKMRRAWEAALGNHNTMQSGTSALLVKLENVPPDALLLEPLQTAIKERRRASLTVPDLLKDIDWTHIRGVTNALILRTLVKYIPALRPHQSAIKNLTETTYRKHQLSLRKSTIFPIGCSGINESTSAGVVQVLDDVFQQQVPLSTDRINKYIIPIAGDQLTVDRIRKAKRVLAKGDTPAETKAFALERPELWHMKWNFGKGIVRSHWWPTVGKEVFGLHHDCSLLKRNFSVAKCDFYPMHHLLEVRFEALILEAVRLVCEERSNATFSETTPLLEVLQKYFECGGKLADTSFDELLSIADTVRIRYVTTAAYYDCQNPETWTREKYGPSAALASPADVFDLHPIPPAPINSSARAQGQDGASSATTGPSDGPAKPPKKHPERIQWRGDRVIQNNVGFLRPSSYYLELCAAIPAGDMGRAWEIMKVLRFCFWGTGSTNYGNELLELACQDLREFTEKLKKVWLENWLVNPSGREGHWQELDLLLEHYNFWIKILFNAKSLDFDSPFLRECVSYNLRGFADLRERFPEIFDIAKRCGKHTHATVSADINALGSHYRKDQVLTFHLGREQPFAVRNEYSDGIDKLRSGQLKTFLDRTVQEPYNVQEDVQAADTSMGDDASQSTDAPANPIVIIDGIPHLETFSADEFMTDGDAN
ncbi:hypothetical protein PsYK624_172050 [Phanerochaete sordida]|uniref:DUF6589 domain-containing protein n=1 Tax=Phanerochaete sordida TaxID=48140 RepID=A0A9P3LN17_9APHY|nr:hypothetical protein PsYK624_172050 [Phanerochaete sordida]